MFAAGGTGGHVYPAIAIADALKAMCGPPAADAPSVGPALPLPPPVEISFVGTRERMEWQAVPAAGYTLHPIPAVSIKRSPLLCLENLLLPWRLIQALWLSLQLVRSLKPHVVVGTGGYVSAPTCLAAILCGVPVVLQEQNAFAGVANRTLGLFAARVFVAFKEAAAAFPKQKCTLMGNPTRAALLSAPREQAVAYFGDLLRARQEQERQQREMEASRPLPGVKGGKPPPATPGPDARVMPLQMGQTVICVLGGSLGAMAVNDAVAACAMRLLESDPNIYLIWQVGPRYYEALRKVVPPHQRLLMLPYVDRMEYLYAVAALVVTRAGAITCSELLNTATRALLIPSPNVAEDHQTRNAEAMVEAVGAEMLPEKDLNGDTLLARIQAALAEDPLIVQRMKERAAAAAYPESAQKMAEAIVQIALQKKHGGRAPWQVAA
eukprot:jgi/Mesvir1/4171/Mv17192-RA.1